MIILVNGSIQDEENIDENEVSQVGTEISGEDEKAVLHYTLYTMKDNSRIEL